MNGAYVRILLPATVHALVHKGHVGCLGSALVEGLTC